MDLCSLLPIVLPPIKLYYWLLYSPKDIKEELIMVDWEYHVKIWSSWAVDNRRKMVYQFNGLELLEYIQVSDIETDIKESNELYFYYSSSDWFVLI